MNERPKKTDTHGALIYIMVLASASDGAMSEREIGSLGEMISFLPVFRGFDHDRIPKLSEECIALLQRPEGLAEALAIVRGSLPERLHDTAYAIACDVIAADGSTKQEELRLLEMLRDGLGIDHLVADAIERAAAARHRRLD